MNPDSTNLNPSMKMITEQNESIPEVSSHDPVTAAASIANPIEEVFGQLIHLCVSEIASVRRQESGFREKLTGDLADLSSHIRRHFVGTDISNETFLTTLSRLVAQNNSLSEKFDRISESIVSSRIEGPFLRDLLEVYQAGSRDDQTAASSESRYLIEQAFERRDFEMIHPEIGAPFDPAMHEAIGFTPTTQKECRESISEVRRAGLSKHGVIRIPARVCVFTLKS
jgi:molecular chaperone GrpE (heat shock protein)